jgi:PPOX class probable F420-dependent enzyme
LERSVAIGRRVSVDEGVLEEAARSPVARLATAAPKGQIDLVPITFALAGTTVVTAVDHKAKQTRRLQRLANIARDPRVTVLVDHYDDDWSTLWWARLKGLAAVVTEGPRFADAIELLVAKYPRHYSPHPPQGPVIIIDITDVYTWRAS